MGAVRTAGGALLFTLLHMSGPLDAE
jgi:hypothetical protein